MTDVFNMTYTLRLLVKKAGFNFICVFVIALGLCISVVDYYFVTLLAYQDMPFEDGDRMSLLRTGGPRNSFPAEYGWDAYRYNYIKENANSFSALGAMRVVAAGIVSDGEYSVSVPTAEIEPALFNVPGVRPLMGRSLLDTDDLPGAESVAIISHRLWQNYYGGSEEIVGHIASINNQPTTVVGVMPPSFGFPYNHDLWLPLNLTPNPLPTETGTLYIAGMLSEDSSFGAATTEIQSILARLSNELPEIYSEYASDVKPYVVMDNAGAEPIAYSMIVAMITIILLCCLNVGNLLLVRTNERHNELLIRSAVGANRVQLVKQVLQESFVICLIGGLLGLLLVAVVLELSEFYLFSSASSGSGIPFWIQPELDSNLLVVALLVVFFIWLLAGGIPAWKLTKIDAGLALGGSGKGSPEIRSGRATNILIGAELITSVFFLILSGALIFEIQAGSRTDLGVETDGLHIATVYLAGADYDEAISRQLYVDALKSEIQSISYNATVTYTDRLPGSSGTLQTYLLEDQVASDSRTLPSQFVVSVADNYFQTMGVDLLEGRYFDFADTPDSLPVVVIDEVFAASLLSDSSDAELATLLGARIQINPQENDEWLTIVGITSHIVQGQTAGTDEGITTLYRPFLQHTDRQIHFVFEAGENSTELVESIRIAAARVDRNIPIIRDTNFEQRAVDNMSGFKIISTIFVILSLTTLVLSASGIYAIISRSVLQRTHEIGIRRALGSSDLRTVMLFVSKGFMYFIFAIVLGGILAALAGQMLSPIFPAILSSFPMAFVIVALLFSIVIFSSSYMPSRKIIAMEPGEALHYE